MTTTPSIPSEAPSLLPCPFCGGVATMLNWTNSAPGALDYVAVQCLACKLCTDKWATSDCGRGRLVAAWNRRTPEPPRGPSPLDRGAREGVLSVLEETPENVDRVAAIIGGIKSTSRRDARAILAALREAAALPASPSPDVRAQGVGGGGDDGLLEAAIEALIWCSGSADFAPEGKARVGWVNMCEPIIKRWLDAINPPKETGR